MKKVTRILLILPVLLAFSLLGWGKPAPVGVSARDTGFLALTPAAETWNLGISSEGAPRYAAIVGRSVGAVGAFRSNRGVSEMTMIFPAASTARTVDSASFYLVSRSGVYPATARLTLRVYDYAGTLKHTVSSVEHDLQTTPLGVWVGMDLKDGIEERVVAPGEFLAFHVQLGGASGGDLDVRPMFDVTLQ